MKAKQGRKKVRSKKAGARQIPVLLAGKLCLSPPMPLVARLCRPEPRPPVPAKKAVTIGQVKGELKAVGQRVGKLRETMGRVKPQTQVLCMTSPLNPGPILPIGGRLCFAGPQRIRPIDVRAYLKAIMIEINAIERHLGGLEKKTKVKRRPRTTPVR